MRESVWKFFNTFRHFQIFEVAHGAIEIFDFFFRILHEIRYLFWGKTYSPEYAAFSFSLEGKIKNPQTLSVLECPQVLLYTRVGEAEGLRKDLDDQVDAAAWLVREQGVDPCRRSTKI